MTGVTPCLMMADMIGLQEEEVIRLHSPASPSGVWHDTPSRGSDEPKLNLVWSLLEAAASFLSMSFSKIFVSFPSFFSLANDTELEALCWLVGRSLDTEFPPKLIRLFSLACSVTTKTKLRTKRDFPISMVELQ